TPGGPGLFSINSVAIGGPTMPEFWSQIKALIPSTETLNVATDLLGDLDYDYDVTPADESILSANLGATTGVTYFRGDLNRDGAIDQADSDIMAAQMGKKLRAPADFDQNFLINGDDFSQIAYHWQQSVPASTMGDATGDGLVNFSDVLVFEVDR